MCYRILGGPLNLDCTKLTIVGLRGRCLDRLVRNKNKYKQVPVYNNCIECQSYHCDSIHESGADIILYP